MGGEVLSCWEPTVAADRALGKKTDRICLIVLRAISAGEGEVWRDLASSPTFLVSI